MRFHRSNRVDAMCEPLANRLLFSSQVGLDTSFGGTGYVQLDFGLSAQSFDRAITLKDGRVLAEGTAYSADSKEQVALAVLQPNGKLSNAFSSDGKLVLPDAVTSSLGYVSDMVQLPDGGILLHGSQEFLKLKLDGTIDSSFGTGGLAPTLGPSNTTDDVNVLANGTIREVRYSGGILRLTELNTLGHISRSIKRTLNFGGVGLDLDSTGITLFDGTQILHRYSTTDLTNSGSFNGGKALDLKPAFANFAASHGPFFNPFDDTNTPVTPTFTVDGTFEAKSGFGLTGSSPYVSNNTVTAYPPAGDPYTPLYFNVSSDGKTVVLDSGDIKGTLLKHTRYDPFQDMPEVNATFGGIFTVPTGETKAFSAFDQDSLAASFDGAETTNGGFYVVGTTFDSITGSSKYRFTIVKTLPVADAAGTGSVTGVLYNDDDGNQSKSADETLNVGKTVFLDTNGNGKLDAGEPTAVTDVNGRYSFVGLAPGNYKVRRLLPSGYTVTTLEARSGGTVAVVANQSTVLDIGSTAQAIVEGSVYVQDAKGNLLEKVNASLVFIDVNHDGFLNANEDSAFTGNDYLGDGGYHFALKPGTYRVRAVPPEGKIPVNYPLGYADITVKAGTITNLSFAFRSPPGTGTIEGTLFNDDNFDGVKQNSETTNAQRTVFLDTNHNNVLDPGETWTRSDNNGHYIFSDVPAGSYYVRRELPAGYRVTTSTAQVNLSADQDLVFNIGSTRLTPS